MRIQGDEWKSVLSKHLSPKEKESLTQSLNVEDGDLLLIVAGMRLHYEVHNQFRSPLQSLHCIGTSPTFLCKFTATEKNACHSKRSIQFYVGC